MNLIWLEDFLALAATGNFSRAAEARHSSQPAFSRRIRALEAWLGADLVDRSTQPARLTDVGEWFREVAKTLLVRVSGLPDDARRVAEASAVTLRLASTHALSFTFLPRWLHGLEADSGLGAVQLMSDVLRQCEVLMQQGTVQFVVSHAHPQAPGALDAHAHVSVRIGDDSLVPVSSPDPCGRPMHRLLRSQDGYAAVPWLRYSDESGLGRILQAVLPERWRASAGRPIFTAHLGSVLRTMALDGRGIAWLPRTLIADDLKDGSLVAAGDAECSIALQIRLYRARDLAGGIAQRFWDTAVARHGTHASSEPSDGGARRRGER